MSEHGPVGGKYGKFMFVKLLIFLKTCHFFHLCRIPRGLPPPPPASLEDAIVCLRSIGSLLCAQFSQEIPLTKASLFSMLTYSWVSPMMVHKILHILLHFQLKWLTGSRLPKNPASIRFMEIR